jgi:Nitrile hydratase beta subunit
MNGVHDLGGMHGHGPINPEANEPIFHGEWERRMFGLFITCFAGGHFNVDMFRHAIEKMGAAHYLETPYYAHWLHSLETLLIENGSIAEGEIEARMAKLSKEGMH